MSGALRRVVVGGLVLSALWGCKDDDGDNTTESPSPSTVFDASVEEDGGAATVIDAGAGNVVEDAGTPSEEEDAGNPEPTRRELVDSCTDACIQQADCTGLSDSSCDSECQATADEFAANDCLAEAVAENDCLATLSCDDLEAYSSEGRRDNADCGDQATRLFENCTIGGGTIPTECRDLCDRYDACDALGVSVSACEENCVLWATRLEHESGRDCSDAFFAFSLCIADASCTDVRDFAQNEVTPDSCASEEEAVNDACD